MLHDGLQHRIAFKQRLVRFFQDTQYVIDTLIECLRIVRDASPGTAFVMLSHLLGSPKLIP